MPHPLHSSNGTALSEDELATPSPARFLTRGSTCGDIHLGQPCGGHGSLTLELPILPDGGRLGKRLQTRLARRLEVCGMPSAGSEWGLCMAATVWSDELDRSSHLLERHLKRHDRSKAPGGERRAPLRDLGLNEGACACSPP